VQVLERGFMEPYFSPQPTAETAAAGGQGGLPARSDPAAAVQGIAVGQITAPSPAQLFGDKNSFRGHGKSNSAVHLNASHLGAARLGPSRERVEEAGEHVAQKWILTRGEDNIRDLLPGPILPPVIDKELLVDAEKELGLSLRAYQEAREWLRDAFWARVHRQFGVGVGKSKG
ncbi:MAG: NYN domain-containing protein, partial [Nocardiopsaceae bacterium]|nr:NYN domain-containing protein [Nocardiopsaceae bacterium]